MISFVLGTVFASTPLSVESLTDLCRPALSRKVDGDIRSISVTSTRRDGRFVTIEGQLTAFLGMASPPPGSASAHHLIRAEFHFVCEIHGRKVRRVTVDLHQ